MDFSLYFGSNLIHPILYLTAESRLIHQIHLSTTEMREMIKVTFFFMSILIIFC